MVPNGSNFHAHKWAIGLERVNVGFLEAEDEHGIFLKYLIISFDSTEQHSLSIWNGTVSDLLFSLHVIMAAEFKFALFSMLDLTTEITTGIIVYILYTQ